MPLRTALALSRSTHPRAVLRYAAAPMEPPAPRPFPLSRPALCSPASRCSCSALGTLLGWIAGSLKAGPDRRRRARDPRRDLLRLPPLPRLLLPDAAASSIPQPVPRTHAPAIVGSIVVVGALPVFLVWAGRSAAGRSRRCSGSPARRSRWFSSGCRSGWVISRALAWWPWQDGPDDHGDGRAARRGRHELRSWGCPRSRSTRWRSRRSSERRWSRTTEGRQEHEEGLLIGGLVAAVALIAVAHARALARRTEVQRRRRVHAQGLGADPPRRPRPLDQPRGRLPARSAARSRSCSASG